MGNKLISSKTTKQKFPLFCCQHVPFMKHFSDERVLGWNQRITPFIRGWHHRIPWFACSWKNMPMVLLTKIEHGHAHEKQSMSMLMKNRAWYFWQKQSMAMLMKKHCHAWLLNSMIPKVESWNHSFCGNPFGIMEKVHNCGNLWFHTSLTTKLLWSQICCNSNRLSHKRYTKKQQLSVFVGKKQEILKTFLLQLFSLQYSKQFQQ